MNSERDFYILIGCVFVASCLLTLLASSCTTPVIPVSVTSGQVNLGTMQINEPEELQRPGVYCLRQGLCVWVRGEGPSPRPYYDSKNYGNPGVTCWANGVCVWVEGE